MSLKMTMVILNTSSGFCMCLLYILLASTGAAIYYNNGLFFLCYYLYSYSLTNKGACMIIVFELNAVDC